MIFRSRRRAGATAVAEPTPAVAEPTPDEINSRSVEELFEEIEALEKANRANRDRQRERRLVRLRHWAGAKLVADAGAKPERPFPSVDELPRTPRGSLPDVSPEDLSSGLLRAGILRDGCLLVRGLVGPDEARRMADHIELLFQERVTLQAGGFVSDAHYEEFEPNWPYGLAERVWVRDGGGVLAADSPKAMFDLMELFERTGLRGIVNDYLGERAAMSVNKSTLRRALPTDNGAWHQDGAFMGDVRAVNIWLSLSHCGDDAPGLDVVPRRLDHIVPTGTEGAVFDWSVSPAVAEEAAGEGGTVRPIFEPGDVLIFDELCLHSTAVNPRMTDTRYAVESWFFGPSAFPDDYTPLAF